MTAKTKDKQEKKRLPHKAQEEILDAMAALDLLKTELQYKETLIENAQAHLTKALQIGTKKEEIKTD